MYTESRETGWLLETWLARVEVRDVEQSCKARSVADEKGTIDTFSSDGEGSWYLEGCMACRVSTYASK